MSWLRQILVLSIAVMIIGACAPALRTSRNATPDTTKLSIDLERVYKLLRSRDTVTVIGVGDIMLGTNFPGKKYLPPDSIDLLVNVRAVLQDANITFGNYEGVFLNTGGDPKDCEDTTKCYLFRTPVSKAQHLKEAGFDLISTANNHSGDFGEAGRKSTARILDSLGIYHAGYINHPYTIFKQGKYVFGFAAFAPNRGVVNLLDRQKVIEILQHLDSLSDIVIISLHAGAEGLKHQHISKSTEFFHHENRGNAYDFAHFVIDHGADIVFGHGPHVTRAIEIYKDRFIAYSLGNFCTYARFNLKGATATAPIIKVFTTKHGKFLSAKVFPVKQIGLGTPILDPKNAVLVKIRHLTDIDFPELKVSIDGKGNINYLDQDF